MVPLHHLDGANVQSETVPEILKNYIRLAVWPAGSVHLEVYYLDAASYVVDIQIALTRYDCFSFIHTLVPHHKDGFGGRFTIEIDLTELTVYDL